MGLDIYINKKKTVENDRDKRERTVKISGVLYLRKANQIHRYFVENFAGGRDECQEICIDIEGIKTLNDICKRIVKESNLKEGWVYYKNTSSRWLDEKDNIELAEKEGDKFVKAGESNGLWLEVGEYIYENDHCASKVEEIEKRDGKYLVRCGQEGREKVITNPELAKELLPTQAGFFFGDTNYGEYYLDDLKEYIRQADEIIADYENEIANGTDKYDLDYTYQASW